MAAVLSNLIVPFLGVLRSVSRDAEVQARKPALRKVVCEQLFPCFRWSPLGLTEEQFLLLVSKTHW